MSLRNSEQRSMVGFGNHCLTVGNKDCGNQWDHFCRDCSMMKNRGPVPIPEEKERMVS